MDEHGFDIRGKLTTILWLWGFGSVSALGIALVGLFAGSLFDTGMDMQAMHWLFLIGLVGLMGFGFGLFLQQCWCEKEDGVVGRLEMVEGIRYTDDPEEETYGTMKA